VISFKYRLNFSIWQYTCLSTGCKTSISQSYHGEELSIFKVPEQNGESMTWKMHNSLLLRSYQSEFRLMTKLHCKKKKRFKRIVSTRAAMCPHKIEGFC
jgi:hypothetical protein